MSNNYREIKIGVIGLGYVGLPLAVLFSNKYPVIGFDINKNRINELTEFKDHTGELEPHEIAGAPNLTLTYKLDELKDASVYIVTVPTPIDQQNMPDLDPLKSACSMLGKILRRNNIVIFESTVFPGATEEICVPILEEISGLAFNEGFFCGYSPERINPGDKVNKIHKIIKVTAGSTPETADFVDELYGQVIGAGTYKAPSIRVAEAAKVIENTQRDLNIALINEFSQLFDALSLDTKEVLDAAASKWNFMSYTPGLVGGHCIGVDPYYLAYKAQSAGYQPELILTARRLNDRMGRFVVTKLIKEMARRGVSFPNAKILILGLTFKENCSDLRNTKVVDVVNELSSYFCEVDLHDPLAEDGTVTKEFKKSKITNLKEDFYDAIIVAVAHDIYKEMGLSKIKSFGKKNSLIFDVKSVFEHDASCLRL